MDGADRVRALLDQRSAQLARRGLAARRAAATRPYLVCACGPDRYGLPLAGVAGIVPGRPCTPLPGAAPALTGIVALSGRVVSVIDLGRALGRGDAEATERAHLVRLRGLPVPVALAVDRVLGIARVGAEASDGESGPVAPDLGTGAVSGYVPPGSDETAAIADGFTILDPARLLRRFLP